VHNTKHETSGSPGRSESQRRRPILHRVAPLLVGATLSIAVAVQATAQAGGTLSGRVVDAHMGRGVPRAQLQVVEAGRGAASEVGGRYTITGLPAGNYSVRITALGYGEKTITGVTIAAEAGATLDVSLSASAVAIQGVTVSAAAERGSARRALDEQRAAPNVTSSISREEISRGPHGDAAQAVQRVSGVTVQAGRYVSVRGLGERYTTTQLNGARLPSPEPDRRVVPLDLFPAGTLESITVSKTFTPDQAGDFTGAQVNLRTRSFGSAFRSLSFSVGANDAVTFRDVLLPPTSGAEWLGFASGQRAIPPALQAGVALDEATQATALSQFRNAWTVHDGTATPNLSLSGSTGSILDLAGREVQLLGALSYRSGVEAQTGETRATAVLRGDETVPLNEYTADTARRGILWGGVFNLSTVLGTDVTLQLNNTYDRTVDNEALHLQGYDEELNTDLEITRLQLVERSIFSSQLVANHDWSGRALEWSATYSRVTRDEPDRSELVYARETGAGGEPVWAFFGGATAPSTRAFGELAERSAAVQADYTIHFRGDEAAWKLGSLYRYTGRDAETRSFDFDNVGLDLDDRALPAEEIFGGRFYDPANPGIRLRSNTFGGSYAARENLVGGYSMLEYPLTSRLEFIGGLRLESANVDVTAVDVLGRRVAAELRDVDLLPAATLNFRPSDRQTIRLSATRTLSRPEYRELADVTYRDHVGSSLVFGNPELRRALIENYDLRWETYPSRGEVMSVALFSKRFRDPIERVILPATGAPVLSFRNARSATNYGVELEMRRRLGFIAAPLDAVTVGTNATLVRSEVDFGGTDAASSATSQKRALLGQAPYVVNLSLIYEAPGQASATILLNAIGERITEVGLAGIPDAYEQPRTSFDITLEHPVRGTGKLRLQAENLLDARSEIRQGSVTRSSYRTGRSYSLGYSFEP
jgi:hypothetical protein